jgi:prepilin-type N-terminal cleavage/methylation domain-containing protein
MRRTGAGSGERYVPLARGGAERAFTLVELIVVLAVMGLTLALTGLALRSPRTTRETDVHGELVRARARAIRTARPVRLRSPSDSGPNRSPLPALLFLPDGRVVGPGVDPLTGRPDGAR